jgi:hypothetical protein
MIGDFSIRHIIIIISMSHNELYDSKDLFILQP